MAYQRPMVMVYQEYDSTAISTPTASLPACIIGPCVHVIDPVEDETLALYGTYTREGIDSGFFPNNAPGALIIDGSVKFRFKNAIVSMFEDCGVKSVSGNSVVLENCDVIIPYIQVGDSVKIGDYNLRVTGTNADTGTILFNRSIPDEFDQASGTLTFTRKVEEIFLDSNTEGTVLLDLTSERFTLTGIMHEIEGMKFFVESAELYVGYHALRQDLSDIGTVYSVNDIEGQCGKICPENPLAFALNIAVANSSTGIMYVGVDSDDLEGYTRAKDRLEQEDPVYAMVPLTFDPGILTMFKMHAEEYSKPEVSKWRMSIGCTKLVTEKTLCENAEGRLSRDGDGDLVVLTASDANVEFLSSNVDAGDDLIIIDDEGNEHKYTIASVAAEDILTITQSDPFDDKLFQVAKDKFYKFRITHHMSREEQARWIRDTSKSYGYMRHINIFPDVCIVDGKEQPGYYLGCAVAAGIASLPSHYGMTRLSLAGVSGVRHAGDYFNNDQLDIMADGGTFIFVQANPSAPPYIRHQLTTDRSTVEYQEVSFVKNFDYISYICRDVLDAFIGKYNICPSTLGSIRSALAGTFETIKLDNQPKIGSRLLSYKIVKLEQLADVRDRVEVYCEISMPYPLNTIGLHLKSVFLQVSSS